MKGPMKIARELAAAISADYDIQAYCTAEFGASLTIKLGVDDDQQPPGSLHPLLDIRPGSYVPANDRSHRMVTVGVALVISKSGTTTVTGATAMAGFDSMEALYQRVETVIEHWAKANHNYQVAYGDSNTEMSYPIYRLTWTLTVQESY